VAGRNPSSHQDGWDADLAAGRLGQRAADRAQARLRLRLGELAGLRAGDAAVEIDCGTGHPLADLPRPVRPDGSVLGSSRDGNGGPARQHAAGLTLPYRFAAVEGNVTRIKMIKGQIYGRAGFALLRKRVILHSG
jgi:hypothetical protein